MGEENKQLFIKLVAKDSEKDRKKEDGHNDRNVKAARAEQPSHIHQKVAPHILPPPVIRIK